MRTPRNCSDFSLSTASSLAGVCGKVSGVVAIDEVKELAVLVCNRLLAASSAASFIDIADAFFFLKENFGFGAACARVFCNLSESAFIALSYLVRRV